MRIRPHSAARSAVCTVYAAGVDPRGAVIVITGGGSGIGRALARRFAAADARGIVLADRNGDTARRVAEEIGERALALACDAADEAQLQAVLAAARTTFGPVDLFCANAGVAVGEGLGTPDEWHAAMSVNVEAHVVAARLLLDEWLARGSGYFLATASAAGLLSQIGSAPYAVTKHAAVGFAEWLALTYGERGIKVSCLCPMGVRTPMLEGEHTIGVGMTAVAASGAMLEPDSVADVVLEGLRAERFLILPHPEVAEFFRRKAADYDRWLAGMSRFQASVAAMAETSR